MTWYGNLQAKEISRILKIERPNAQALISNYKSIQEYQKGKSFIKRDGRQQGRTEDYIPPKEMTEARKFLDQLRGQTLAEEYFPTDQAWDTDVIEFENLEEIGRTKPKFNIVRSVVSAIKSKRLLMADYHSRTGKTEKRIISPARLVYAADRYHVRSFCYTKMGWRDFVLTRFDHIEDYNNDQLKWVDPETDSEWTQNVELTFEPNKKLKPEIIETLRRDYSLKKDKALKIICRKANVKYAKIRFQRPDLEQPISQWELKTENDMS